jgi:hypothetical protein
MARVEVLGNQQEKVNEHIYFVITWSNFKYRVKVKMPRYFNC